MTDKREFGIGAVLSLVGGRNVAEGGFGDVAELLEYLAGGPVWTHQFPRVSEEVKPALLAQLPHLVGDLELIEKEGRAIADGERTLEDVLIVWRERYGAKIALSPAAAGTVKQVNPFTELTEMMGKRRAS